MPLAKNWSLQLMAQVDLANQVSAEKQQED
jgi:hypothetical protein